MTPFDWSTVFVPIVAFLSALRAPVAGLLLAAGGCLGTGCATLTKDQAESQRAIMQNWTDFAKENGVSFVGQASYTGRGGLYQQSLWGIDTGLQAQGTFFFDPSKVPMPVEAK